MSGPSYTGRNSGGFFVTETMEGCHAKHPTYTLLEGDWLFKRKDGTYGKFGPGLGIEGFVLTPEQEATLRPNDKEIAWGIGGMDFFLSGDGKVTR